ncbi:MAG: nitroreductase [Hyphomicrobiales bacterium]|nr:nitroreductase [Hyphomicrobiales bacterium]
MLPERHAGETLDDRAKGAGADLLLHLRTRRSVSANALMEPGPSAEDLAQMLTIAARAPDHKKLAPWRFIVFEGEARARFGETLAAIVSRREPEASEVRIEAERRRFLRAPVVVAVISSPKPHPAAPEWEQTLSAGAVCLNLLHAAAAFGYAGNWITEWCAYDAEAGRAIGLADGERVAGFIYLGSARERPPERERPDMNAIVTRWTPTDLT